jgi:uncharacterized phage protein (TIGR02220 family)
MMAEYLALYRTHFETIKALPKSRQMGYLEAMVDYALDDIEPEFKPGTIEACTWIQTKHSIDRTKMRAKARSDAGKKGGRPAKDDKPSTSENVNEKKQTKANESKRKQKKLTYTNTDTKTDTKTEEEIMSGKPDGEPVENSKITEIVDFLNATCSTAYRPTAKPTQRHIHARLAEGFTVDDFKAVIAHKHDQWGNDPKMREYLRPETLFGTKFEGYLNDARAAERPKESRFAAYDRVDGTIGGQR